MDNKTKYIDLNSLTFLATICKIILFHNWIIKMIHSFIGCAHSNGRTVKHINASWYWGIFFSIYCINWRIDSLVCCVRTITQLFLSVKINSDTFFKIWYFMMYLHNFDYFLHKLLKMLWVLQIILDISAQQMIMIVILSKMMIYSGM